MFFFSPLLQRQFSSSTISPGSTFEAAVDPVGDEADRFAEQLPEAHGHRHQRVFRLQLALGRPTEVRGDHHRSAVLEAVLQGRQRRTDARVLGDVAGIVLRHVEVGADEDAFAFDVEVGKLENVHGRLLRKSEMKVGNLLSPVAGDIEQAVGEAPLVVEPQQQVEHVLAGKPRLTAVDDRRVRVVVEVDRGVRRRGVGQQRAPGAAAALASRSFTSSTATGRPASITMSIAETLAVGTRIAFACTRPASCGSRRSTPGPARWTPG